MSVARGGIKNLYSNIEALQIINLQFTVNSTDSGGLGVTSPKSNGWIESIFMHTTATAGVSAGVTNPNPASGIASIRLKQNFNAYLGCALLGIQSPVTGGALTSVTNHTIYQIVTVGTTTTAQWVTAGLPVGITPAAGVSFVAIATASIGGSGTVKVLTVSGVSEIETIGNPNLAINSNIASNAGQYVNIQFLGATNSSTTTLIPTAPADTSVVSLALFFDRSSVTIDGL